MINIRTDMYCIFKNNHVVDMESLQIKLENKSTRSIFRYLENAGYISSFSHSGKYYTLNNIPRFNSDGLWFYKEIGFSKFGTLKNTIIHIIQKSDAGKTHDELKKQLHIRVQNTLLDLVRSNKITRRKINGDYVYFTIDMKHIEKQISGREKYSYSTYLSDYSDWIVIEILVEIIRTTESEEIEPSKIISNLASRKLAISEDQIKYVLNKFDLKKTPE